MAAAEKRADFRVSDSITYDEDDDTHPLGSMAAAEKRADFRVSDSITYDEDDDIQVFGGGTEEKTIDSLLHKDGARAKNNDYLGMIAELPPEKVRIFDIGACFTKVGLDFSDPESKISWHSEVGDVLSLLDRCLVDGTASLKRIMSTLEQYDAGKMNIELVFPSSVEKRTVEQGIREPAHALKGAAATISLDRLALACRDVEHPLKVVLEEMKGKDVPEADRRARIDAILGPKRELIQKIWAKMEEVFEWIEENLLGHVLEHRCGIADSEAAHDYIPSLEQMAAGKTMPPGEPAEYNREDWDDDCDEVEDHVEEFLEKFHPGWFEAAMAPFARPG